MYTSIAAKQLTNKFGVIIKKNLPHRQQPAHPSRPAKKLKMDSDVLAIDNTPDDSDPDDGEYVSDELLIESSEDGDTEIEEDQPSNAEAFSFFYGPSDLHSLCIDCRYPPFKNHSNHWTWIRKEG